MSRFRTTSAATLIAMLVLAACSDAATTTTTIAPVATTGHATTQASTATTEPAITTSSEPTTTTVVATGAVGSREALLEAMQPALEFSESIFGADSSTAPIPEINGPDPVEALRELLLLDFWVYSNAPLDSWADVLAVRESPDWSLYLGAFDRLFFRVATFDESVESPFEVIEARLATQEERDSFPQELVGEAGPEAVAVVYRTRLAPHILKDPEAPEADEALGGWEDRSQVALLLPTELGWRFFWSEVDE